MENSDKIITDVHQLKLLLATIIVAYKNNNMSAVDAVNVKDILTKLLTIPGVDDEMRDVITLILLFIENEEMRDTICQMLKVE